MSEVAHLNTKASVNSVDERRLMQSEADLSEFATRTLARVATELETEARIMSRWRAGLEADLDRMVRDNLDNCQRLSVLRETSRGDE